MLHPLAAISFDSLFNFFTAVIAAYVAWSTKRVKDDLKENTDKTEAVHKLVNGDRSAALHTIAADKRRIADLTGTEADKAVAAAAEKMAREHDLREPKTK